MSGVAQRHGYPLERGAVSSSPATRSAHFSPAMFHALDAAVTVTAG